MFSEKAKKKFLFYRFITHPSVICPAVSPANGFPASFCLP